MARGSGNKRVFINDLNSYTSRHIAEFLSSCAVGASLSNEEVSYVDDEEEQTEENHPVTEHGTFQIVGTISDQSENRLSFITEGFTNLSREELLQRLLQSDVIIYNITERSDQLEEAWWAVLALHSNMEAFPAPKTFILVSSVMTWAKTSLPELEDPEVPFIDEDYRRRKPHPNFKDHITLEKLVVKLGKKDASKFCTFVVAAGLQYGLEEQCFHFFFKASWSGALQKIPVFGEGSNVIPTVHVMDLAGIVQNVIDRRPKHRYFLAVDNSRNTLAEMIGAVASALGEGKTKTLPKEDVYLTRELTQANVDFLFVDLRMEAFLVKESFHVRWVSDEGMVKNIMRMVEEYKLSRGLLPVRICILGPPAVGKSTLAEKICKYYKLHHVRLKETIAETLSKLEQLVEDENEDESAEAQTLLETLKTNMEQNGGRLDEQHLIMTIRNKLKSQPCRNQGFVLDGFPKTTEQAEALFTDDGDENEDPTQFQSKIPPQYMKIQPDFLFSLDASDELLKTRVLNLPESVVEGTSYRQEKFIPCLRSYRMSNKDDQTVLNFFDELHLQPQNLVVTSDDPAEYKQLMKMVKNVVGKLRNYGPSREELEQEKRKQEEIRLREEEELRLQNQRKEEEEQKQRMSRWEEWTRGLEEVRQVEENLLEAQAAPLKLYLMESVMPTLTQGLIQCCKVRPEDPVDFLAEYLLRNNPETL